MFKKLLLIISASLLPFTLQADKLHFSVTNNSRASIIFSSTDWYDSETHVLWQQTAKRNYSFPAKNIYFMIASGIWSEYYTSFYVKLDPSCEQLGLPAVPDETGPIPYVTGKATPARYAAGNVHVTIDEEQDSSLLNYHLRCSVEKS